MPAEVEQRAQRAFTRCYDVTAKLTRLPGLNNAVFRGEFAAQSRVLKMASPEHAERLNHEVRVIRVLAKHAIPVAEIEHFDVIDGWPFVLMLDAGRSTVADWAENTGAKSAGLFADMGMHLADVHRICVDTDLAESLPLMDDAAYRRQLSSIRAWAQHSGFLNAAQLTSIDELTDTLPALQPDALCHHDFHATQCAVEHGRISALLDWEEAGIGNRLVDLALARANLAQYASQQNLETFTAAYLTRAGLASYPDAALLPIAVVQGLALARAWSRRGNHAGLATASAFISSCLSRAQ